MTTELPIFILVPVADPDAAVAFYETVLGAVRDPNDTRVLYLDKEHTFALRVLAGSPADPATPRYEFVVNDVDAWVERAVGAGATLVARLSDENDVAMYAQCRDLFGHLWAATAAE